MVQLVHLAGVAPPGAVAVQYITHSPLGARATFGSWENAAHTLKNHSSDMAA